MIKTILGIFSEREYAERAITRLEEAEFRPQDISIIMKDAKEGRALAEDTGVNNVASGAATGATTGAVIGGLAGLLVGIGAIALPGIGAILIAGPLATALGLTGAAATTASGAVTGAVAGGLLGALVSLGIPENEAHVYEKSIREGGILVAVPATSATQDMVESILEEEGAEKIRTISASTRQYADKYDEPPEEKAHYANRGYAMGAKGGRASYTEEDVDVANSPAEPFDENDIVGEEPMVEGEKGGQSTRGWFEEPQRQPKKRIRTRK